MRMRTYSRPLRVISAIVLFFFVWTFGPIWQVVAIAATNQKTAARGQSKDGSRRLQPAQITSGEKFEAALEEIREKVGKADDKAGRGDSATGEIEAIKAKRTEIGKLDIELKKEFSVTEKTLKDAKLPKEILDRHYKFVKHYEDNLNELKANLDGIGKPSAKSQELRAALAKAKTHLEKVKPPKKHVPLDPNKLPNRMVKAKARAPRLKKEEFEKDFPTQKKAKKFASVENTFVANTHELSRIKHKPIQLAFNDSGTFSDQPLSFRSDRFSASSSTSINDFIPQLALSDSTPILLAQATDAPTADDLAENGIEIQFTDDIKAKAQELGYSPVKIYEYVRNNIEFVPTYGSIQGAQMTLESKMGNAFDTASLLIALLRASGIPAKYVYGTVEIPIEKAMNWVGGVTDLKMAGTVFATNGVPAKVVISGSTIKAVQIEHVWVKAFVDYIPSRGAVHKQGDTWIPLDASFKQYTYTQGLDIQSAVPFDAQSFADQIQSTATINPDGSVTNVNSTLVQQTMQDYQTKVQNYIQQSYPNATVGDVIGKKEIVKQEFPILLGTLLYKTIQAGVEFAEIPSGYRATMSFSIPDPTGIGSGLSYTTNLPQIAGKKITLSFSPATASDQKVVESLLPQPHADGTPIQPSELPSSFPAYLINLKPELRVDGQVAATGSSVMMGSAQSFTMSLNEPGNGVSNIDNTVQAGEYYGIGVDTCRIGASRINALKTKLESTKAKLDAQTYDGLTKDDLVGDMLYTTIASYFAELDVTDQIAAMTMDVIRYRAPSVGMSSLSLNIKEVFGVPTSAAPRGMMMDVDRAMQAVFSKDGNMDKVKQYMLASGNMSSALESVVPEQIYSTVDNPVKAISSVKALQIANDQGIPIYTANQSNINTILPNLQVSEDVKNDILIAVNAGKEITVSKTNINYNGWIGCGYIISDPVTGAGAYMISSGENGALFILGVALLLLALSILAGPIAFVFLSLLLPIYLTFLTWLMTQASSAAQDCVAAIAINILAAITVRNILIVLITSRPIQVLINSIRTYFGGSATQSNCLGTGLAY